MRSGLVDRGAPRALRRGIIDELRRQGQRRRTAAARSLSGGNLQKFIVGREIALAPKLLIVAQPTWGVDVGAAAFIRQALIDLRRAGAAVLVVSEELDELFEICDRLRSSPAAGCRRRCRPRPTREEIGLLMTGSATAPQANGGGDVAPQD